MRQEVFINNRTDYTVGCKKVSVIDNHNFALPIWAEYCAKTEKEYRLITFDYHMDTRPSFSQYAYRKCECNMTKVNSYVEQDKIFEKYIRFKYDVQKIEELAERYVYYDEQIMVAYQMGYIKDFYCICKDRQDHSHDYKHYLVLEDEAVDLEAFCNEGMTEEYILDIDLDFFNSEQDYSKYETNLLCLIQNTDIITVAKEYKSFNLLNMEPAWTNDKAFNMLMELITKA